MKVAYVTGQVGRRTLKFATLVDVFISFCQDVSSILTGSTIYFIRRQDP